jgi:hypothetical protein
MIKMASPKRFVFHDKTNTIVATALVPIQFVVEEHNGRPPSGKIPSEGSLLVDLHQAAQRGLTIRAGSDGQFSGRYAHHVQLLPLWP